MIDGILYYFCVFIIIDLATEIHERKYTEAEASAKYLSLSAGNTITLSGASLKADDKAELTAGKDIRLTAEKDLYAEDASVGKRKGSYYQRLKTEDEAVKGTLISSAGEVRLKAGEDISLKGSGITSEKGKISLTAGKDISMMDEKEHHETIHEYHSHVSGLLSSKTKDLYEAGKTDPVRGSLISGNETHMESGRDMTITGSAVVSDEDTTLLAGRNFKAESAEERSGSTYRESVKKRGLLSGGLGFTMGSEKRKDRYDSEAVEQVGSTIGSVEGSVHIGAGKDADIEASHISAGKDLAVSGKNVTITSKDNVYTNKEEHEYKRSGLSVSLGGSLVNTVNSVVSPLTRAGEVKDRRLSALYGLEAGKNLKGAVSGYMDNVKTIDAMKADMSRIDTLREAVKTDGIAAPMTESNLENIRDAEGKIMDKAKADNQAKRSMSLDVSFGTAKSHSLSEERTIQTEGSTLHAKDTLTVKSGENMTVKGSQMSAKDVYLKAGKDIRILSAENSSTTREKENSSSASLGGSIGSSGLTGIRASYGRGRKEGKSEEISHTESTIKADHTLSLESGRDTALKGSRIEGEKVQADAGGSLSMESEQDRKTYRENGKNTGISLGYDIPSGKVSGFASAGKSHTDSRYESVTNQAGIYAGDKGFDITVEDNTHLKGAVIDSKGSADKNTLRTGTLSWEDVENKADYKAGGMGISYAPKDISTPLNTRGLTPQMSPTVKDKEGSTTKAAIAKGTIIITNKKNQNQDISTLNRDTENSLNKLNEIFDKSKVEEKQELLGMMEKYGNQAIHAYAESRGWKDGSAEKVLLHGAFGALMGDMGTGETLAGALSGSIHEYVMGYLNRTKSPEWVRTHPDTVEWLSAGLGAVIGKVSDASISGMAGISLDAAKWNYLGFELPEMENLLKNDLVRKDGQDISQEELINLGELIRKTANKGDPEGASSDTELFKGNATALSGVTIILKNQYTDESVNQLMNDYDEMVLKMQEIIKRDSENGNTYLRPVHVTESNKNIDFDAYMIQYSAGPFEQGYIFDPDTQKFYRSEGYAKSNGSFSAGIEVAGIVLKSGDENIKLDNEYVRHDIFTGSSVGVTAYAGIGGGISTPLASDYQGKVFLIKYGSGTPQIGASYDVADEIPEDDVPIWIRLLLKKEK
jgi:filamentous hemagglutinin